MADLNVTLSEATQITGFGEEIAVQVQVAPAVGTTFTIPASQTAYVQVNFAYDTVAQVISQAITAGGTPITITNAAPFTLDGLYYPGGIYDAAKVSGKAAVILGATKS
ncbi:MAG: hypothetical protein ACRCTE_13765 [Cellulosilyticaceae bacterium]